MGWNQISDLGCQHLCSALQSNTTLQELDLEGNKISDLGLQNLCSALQSTQRKAKPNKESTQKEAKTVYENKKKEIQERSSSVLGYFGLIKEILSSKDSTSQKLDEKTKESIQELMKELLNSDFRKEMQGQEEIWKMIQEIEEKKNQLEKLQKQMQEMCHQEQKVSEKQLQATIEHRDKVRQSVIDLVSKYETNMKNTNISEESKNRLEHILEISSKERTNEGQSTSVSIESAALVVQQCLDYVSEYERIQKEQFSQIEQDYQSIYDLSCGDFLLPYIYNSKRKIKKRIF